MRKLAWEHFRFETFLEDYADWSSFRYFGKGLKLGNKNAIVCWYKLKAAKDPSTYRVVYGDLSVKDVAAKDLPLPVGEKGLGIGD